MAPTERNQRPARADGVRSFSSAAREAARPAERQGTYHDDHDDHEEKSEVPGGNLALLPSPGHLTDEDEWYGAEASYAFHLQLAPGSSGLSGGFPCPICLRLTQLPIRQDCGHVLCLYCMQQALSAIGGCPLCQAQQLFKVGREEPMLALPVAAGMDGIASLDFAHSPAVQDTGALSSSMSSVHEGPAALLQLQQARPSNDAMPTSESFDSSKNSLHPDLLPDPNDLPLQLDNLSDLDDMIDLADLVSSDSDRPPPPVTARTSINGSSTPGPARRPRSAQNKKADASASVAPSARAPPAAAKKDAKSPRAATSMAGKRKVRPRKSKTIERALVALEWRLVETGGTAPEQRYDCGFAVYGSRLIVVGGIVGKLRLNDLHVLDLAESPTPQWIQPPLSGTPPPSGSLLQIFVIGDVLYVIGGTIDGKFLTELHALNLKSEEWKWEKLEVAGKPPSMRYWYSVAVVHGMAILYGGYGHPQRLSDTFALRFDTEKPTWMELSPSGDLPGLASTHSVCVNKDRMYIFGGYDGKFRRGQLYAFEIESVSKDAVDCVWRKVETLGRGPAPRYTHSGASIGSKLIIYGGNSGCLKGDVNVLELEGEMPTWKQARTDPPQMTREWHRVVVYDEAMYVFGGHTPDGNDNKLFRLTFATHAAAG